MPTLTWASPPRSVRLIARVDPDDPELDAVMAGVRQTPGGLCLRIVPHLDNGEFEALQPGGFEPLFAAAETHQVRGSAWLPGRSQALLPYLTNFPHVPVVLDHTGVGGIAREQTDERDRQFEEVLSLARFPNFALKWCHASQRFSHQTYPFHDAMPFLRRALEANSLHGAAGPLLGRDN